MSVSKRLIADPTWDEMESMAFDVSVEKAPIIAPEPASPFPNPEPVLLPRL